MLTTFASIVLSCFLTVGQVGEQATNFSLENTLGQTVDVNFGQGEVFLLAFIGSS